MKRFVDAVRAFFGPFAFVVREAWREKFGPTFPSYVVSAAERAGLPLEAIAHVSVRREILTVYVAPAVDLGQIGALALHLSYCVPADRRVLVERMP